MPLFKDTAISANDVKILSKWAQIVNKVRDTDYTALPQGSNERQQSYVSKQMLDQVLSGRPLADVLGKSPTTVDKNRKFDITSEPVQGKVQKGRATLPEDWQTCLCYLYAAGLEQVPDVNRQDAKALEKLAAKTNVDKKARESLDTILDNSKVYYASGNDPELPKDREARLEAGVVKLQRSEYAPIPNFADTASPVYEPAPDLTNEPQLFAQIVARGKSLAEAATANGAGVVPKGFVEVPAEDSMEGEQQRKALERINAKLYQQGSGMGAITINGKQYLPYDFAALADQSYLCSPTGLSDNSPNGLDEFPEVKNVLAMTDYLAKVVSTAHSWEPAIQAYGRSMKSLERLEVLGNEMRSFGCKTIAELKSTREFIDEAYRDSKGQDESLPDFEERMLGSIKSQADKADQKLTMKEFCERLRDAAESIHTAGTEEKKDIVNDVLLGNTPLAEVEQRAADPTTKREKKEPEEKPEKKLAAETHGR